MKKFLITVFMAAVLTAVSAGISNAENPVPTDFEILAGLFSTGIHKIIEPHATGTFEKSPKSAFVSYSHGISLSGKTREYFEAILTEAGFSITADGSKSDYVFTVSVTGARVILAGNNGGFNRTAQINVHLKCDDSSMNVLFAGSRAETYHDTIPKKSARLSNDIGKFSRNLKRQMIRERLNRIRIISLLIISGVLVYFTFV